MRISKGSNVTPALKKWAVHESLDRKLYAAFDIHFWPLDFRSWEMPTQYQELLTEFEAARARFKKARSQAEREAAVTDAQRIVSEAKVASTQYRPHVSNFEQAKTRARAPGR
jgi:hypothetical protein